MVGMTILMRSGVPVVSPSPGCPQCDGEGWCTGCWNDYADGFNFSDDPTCCQCGAGVPLDWFEKSGLWATVRLALAAEPFWEAYGTSR